jgi:hypothetical protein
MAKCLRRKSFKVMRTAGEFYYAEMPVKDESTEAWVKGNAAYLASTRPAGEA